jgi:ABC-type sugar transport system substrate-binding protein
MKKLSVIACLVALAAFILAACAAPTTPAPAAPAAPAAAAPKGIVEGKKLAFVLFSFDGYQQGQGSWFKKYAEAEGATVTLIDGKANAEVQLKAMEDAMATNPDGIVWHVVNGPAAVNALKAAQAAKIPVVVAGSRPDPQTGVTVPFVQLYDYEIAKEGGKKAAAWLKANKPGEKAKLVYFDRTGVIHCEKYRGDGFIAGVTEVMGKDNVQIVFRDGVTASQDAALAKMEDLLQAKPDFNMFWGCGATHVMGGLKALEEAGRGKAVKGVPVTEFIMSIDGTPEEILKLLDPNSALKATIGLTPKENAAKHFATLKRIMSGELALNDNITVLAPGSLLPTDCAKLNEYLSTEYSGVKGYEPIDCTKFK